MTLTVRISATTLLLALASLAQESLAQTKAIRLGGPAAIRDSSPNAFGYPAPALSRRDRRAFLVGNSFFKQNWVEAPATTTGRDGLGPLFNARSCSSCHLRDGRSSPPAPGDHDRHGLLIRIGLRTDGPDQPHPAYGGQIQDVALPGGTPEARVDIEHHAVIGSFGDGTPFELARPSYTLEQLGYGPLGEGTTLGPRIAPQLIGLGLLEAVPARVLEALADPQDANGDGISGRIHRLPGGSRAIGRFGWKATQPTVADQTAAAFVNDIGITSHLFPDEALTEAQRAGTTPQNPEISRSTLDRVVFYTQALAVPDQRNPDHAAVVRGTTLFESFGCAKCHTPELETGPDAFHVSYRNRRFRPYTDLLLHDMGEVLADNKRDGNARPAEWRTPPLWGIGLVQTVNGHTRYLHDGRARNLTEAVLWHGGEGEASREAFRTAEGKQRADLLAFLRSL